MPAVTFEDIEKLVNFIKNKKKHPIAIIIVLIITWIIAFNISIDYKIKKSSVKLITTIIISIIEFMIWIYLKDNLNKNDHSKKGIAFLICSKEIEKNDLEKKVFLKC